MTVLAMGSHVRYLGEQEPRRSLGPGHAKSVEKSGQHYLACAHRCRVWQPHWASSSS
jgi:hypothetical protein